MVTIDIDDARRLVWHLMQGGKEPDPLWVASASRHELTAWLANYAAPLPGPWEESSS